MSDTFVAGQWNAICDRCGEKHKSSKIRLEWTGLRVCAACWEPRHPQDFIKGVPDRQAPAWVRPEIVSEPFLNDGGTDVQPGDL